MKLSDDLRTYLEGQYVSQEPDKDHTREFFDSPEFLKWAEDYVKANQSTDKELQALLNDANTDMRALSFEELLTKLEKAERAGDDSLVQEIKSIVSERVNHYSDAKNSEMIDSIMINQNVAFQKLIEKTSGAEAELTTVKSGLYGNKKSPSEMDINELASFVMDNNELGREVVLKRVYEAMESGMNADNINSIIFLLENHKGAAGEAPNPEFKKLETELIKTAKDAKGVITSNSSNSAKVASLLAAEEKAYDERYSLNDVSKDAVAKNLDTMSKVDLENLMGRTSYERRDIEGKKEITRNGKKVEPKDMTVSELASFIKGGNKVPEDVIYKKLKSTKKIEDSNLDSFAFLLDTAKPKLSKDPNWSAYKKAESLFYKTSKNAKPIADPQLASTLKVLDNLEFTDGVTAFARKPMSAKKQQELKEELLQMARLEAMTQLATSKEPITKEAFAKRFEEVLAAQLVGLAGVQTGIDGKKNMRGALAELASGKKYQVTKTTADTYLVTRNQEHQAFSKRLHSKLGGGAEATKTIDVLSKTVIANDKKLEQKNPKSHGLIGQAVASGAWGVAYGSASMVPFGVAAVATVHTGVKVHGFMKKYQEAKAQAQDKGEKLGFLSFAWNNKMEVAGIGLTAATAVGATIAGYTGADMVAYNTAKLGAGFGLAFISAINSGWQAHKEGKPWWKAVGRAAKSFGVNMGAFMIGNGIGEVAIESTGFASAEAAAPESSNEEVKTNDGGWFSNLKAKFFGSPEVETTAEAQSENAAQTTEQTPEEKLAQLQSDKEMFEAKGSSEADIAELDKQIAELEDTIDNRTNPNSLENRQETLEQLKADKEMLEAKGSSEADIKIIDEQIQEQEAAIKAIEKAEALAEKYGSEDNAPQSSEQDLSEIANEKQVQRQLDANPLEVTETLSANGWTIEALRAEFPEMNIDYNSDGVIESSDLRAILDSGKLDAKTMGDIYEGAAADFDENGRIRAESELNDVYGKGSSSSQQAQTEETFEGAPNNPGYEEFEQSQVDDGFEEDNGTPNNPDYQDSYDEAKEEDKTNAEEQLDRREERLNKTADKKAALDESIVDNQEKLQDAQSRLNQAIANEDYTLAKEIKSEVDDLKQDINKDTKQSERLENKAERQQDRVDNAAERAENKLEDNLKDNIEKLNENSEEKGTLLHSDLEDATQKRDDLLDKADDAAKDGNIDKAARMQERAESRFERQSGNISDDYKDITADDNKTVSENKSIHERIAELQGREPVKVSTTPETTTPEFEKVTPTNVEKPLTAEQVREKIIENSKQKG